MTKSVDIGVIYSAKGAMFRQCHWLCGELLKLEQKGADEGRSAEIRTLVETLRDTVVYDVGDAIERLATKLEQPGENVRAPAGMIIRWLHEDIRPLADLAAPAFKDGARPTPLQHLLMVAAGELMTHWNTIRDELKPIEPDPFGPILDPPSK